jgi:hypothetical protein
MTEDQRDLETAGKLCIIMLCEPTHRGEMNVRSSPQRYVAEYRQTKSHP